MHILLLCCIKLGPNLPINSPKIWRYHVHLYSGMCRAFNLDKLCSLVKELVSTPFETLPTAKANDFMAALRDIKSVNIDVSWIFGGFEEPVDLNTEKQNNEHQRDHLNFSINDTRSELKAREEVLAMLEK